MQVMMFELCTSPGSDLEIKTASQEGANPPTCMNHVFEPYNRIDIQQGFVYRWEGPKEG
jgi:hypothetical protein